MKAERTQGGENLGGDSWKIRRLEKQKDTLGQKCKLRSLSKHHIWPFQFVGDCDGRPKIGVAILGTQISKPVKRPHSAHSICFSATGKTENSKSG